MILKESMTKKTKNLKVQLEKSKKILEKKEIKDVKFPSELRLDTISRDWVIVAKTRSKKPEGFVRKKVEKKSSSKDCPFCKIETQLPPLLLYTRKEKIKKPEGIPKDWTTIVIPNKFPALIPTKEINIETTEHIYEKITATGFCELVVTDKHNKFIPDMDLWQVSQIIDAYQQRYLDLMDEKFVKYISIFHNKGPLAGASQPHNHSQIITTPLIDVSLKHSLINANHHWEKHKKCVYCDMIKVEKKLNERIIYENTNFIALCPFASKLAFQIVITPKDHLPYFERITTEQKRDLAEILQKSLQALKKGLGDPDYNFYIRTAPCDGQAYDAYHWHLTILPKTDKTAGFELGTKMEICSIEPEKAAIYLKKYI